METTAHPDTARAPGDPDFAIPAGAPCRIVVRCPNWLGDAVMNLAAVRNLKAGFPHATIACMAREKIADLYRSCKFVDEVLPIPRSAGLLETGRLVRAGKFDWALLMPGSVRVVLEAVLGGVPCRAGFAVRGRRWLGLNKPLPSRFNYGRTRHQSLVWLHAVSWLGGASDASPVTHPSGGARGDYGVIAPGAEFGPAKRWDAARFAEAAKELGGRVAKWIVVGAPGDAPVCAKVAEALPGAENRCGATTLAELIEILCGAKLTIANDSGVMHLAGFCGSPTVAVFGSTEPRATAPYNAGVHVARHQIACSPCFKKRCPFGHARCLDLVSVADVVALAADALDGRTPRPKAGLAWHPPVVA